MISAAITDKNQLKQLDEVFARLKNQSPVSYAFFMLIYKYGLKQDDIFNSSISYLRELPNTSAKYWRACIDESLLSLFKSPDDTVLLKDLLPTRDGLYKTLHAAGREFSQSTGISLNSAVLQKTCAFRLLCENVPLEYVMGLFNYRNGVFNFLNTFLGLTQDDCLRTPDLKEAYYRAAFYELSRKDFSVLSYEQLELLNNSILTLLGFF